MLITRNTLFMFKHPQKTISHRARNGAQKQKERNNYSSLHYFT